jgi:hypothetical protein
MRESWPTCSYTDRKVELVNMINSFRMIATYVLAHKPQFQTRLKQL